MSADRPEWVRCIQHTHAAKVTTSWCGRKLWSYEWSFQSLDHAAYNGQQEGRQLACPQCLAAAVKALTTGQPEKEAPQGV